MKTPTPLFHPSVWRGLCVLAACLAGPAGVLAAPLTGCLIEPERSADVGSPVAGVIERIEVERGQRVRKGQVLAVLRAEVERASLDVAKSRADSNADLEAAAANAAFNRDRLVRAEDLFRQSFISQQALDQARTEARLADQKLKQAREQRAISRQERDVAEAQLSQRVIRSPMDGVVAERHAAAGERADDKPLLRIARIDPLRVQLVVPTSLYGQVRVGGKVGVSPELPGAARLIARVTMVDKVIDPASNTFRVQLELPNPDLALPAGLRCKAEIDAAAVAAAEPAPGATRHR
ncbi:efflux RND transporter periplasmic adaptor subunit [Sphaerotilus microaerophilus]|nr:efflux RND transporter periplasmic adaptor subunit [Sphaerotilus sp. FB-5]